MSQNIQPYDCSQAKWSKKKKKKSNDLTRVRIRMVGENNNKQIDGCISWISNTESTEDIGKERLSTEQGYKGAVVEVAVVAGCLQASGP